MEQATLKIFGTGQITIPKKWRDSFGTSTFKAFFDTKTNEMSLKPIKILEIENFKPMSYLDFKDGLKETGFTEEFVDDVARGFRDSSLCLDK